MGASLHGCMVCTGTRMHAPGRSWMRHARTGTQGRAHGGAPAAGVVCVLTCRPRTPSSVHPAMHAQARGLIRKEAVQQQVQQQVAPAAAAPTHPRAWRGQSTRYMGWGRARPRCVSARLVVACAQRAAMHATTVGVACPCSNAHAAQLKEAG